MAPTEPQEDDIPTPRQVKGWRIFTIAFLACMGACMFGYNLGVIGGCITLPNFHTDFDLPETGTPEYNYIVANIVSSFQGGTIFGALLGYPLTEKFGRIPTLRLAALIFIAGSGMQTWANGSLGLMYAGRLIGGLGIGGTSLLIPLYLSEISPPSIRGFLVGMHEILNQISSCAGFWVNYGTLPLSGSNQWRIPLAIQILPGGLLFIACFIIPESPRWLIKNERFEQAGRILSRIRNLPLEHEYLRKEFTAMKNQAELEKAAGLQANANERGLSRIFGPGDLKRLGVGVLMMVAQQLTGINAMNYYSPAIFKSIGFSGTNVGLFATGIYAIVKAVATLLSLAFFIDRAGRRKLLIIGATGASLAMWYIGGYIVAAKVDPNDPQNKSAAAWVGIVGVYVYAMFFSIAWNAIPWIYCSEIFPGRIRALCVSITTATQWLGQFVIARATPYMISNIGGGTYMFFAASMVVIVFWVYFFIPETKGRTLESMDELFGVDRRATVITTAEVLNEKKEADDALETV